MRFTPSSVSGRCTGRRVAACIHDDVVSFQARALRDLVDVVVPFMDEHLPPSHKREHYLHWREALVSYWNQDARRRRPCSIEGCDAPSRAFGLCGHHYFLEYRR